MRPGLVFLGLFAVLTALYVLLADSIGTVFTFILQAALVLVILAAALWFRRLRDARGWHLPRGSTSSDGVDPSIAKGAEEHGVPKAN